MTLEIQHIITQLYLRTIFMSLLPPTPLRALGESPDGHVPWKTGGFGPVPARTPGFNTCSIFMLAPSAASIKLSVIPVHRQSPPSSQEAWTHGHQP